MKLASFTKDGDARFGLLTGDGLINLNAVSPRAAFTSMQAFIQSGAAGDLAARDIAVAPPADALRPLDEVRLTAPLRPSTVLCAGSNYQAHNAEKAGAPMSGKEPEFFLKTSDCVIGPDQDIIHDPGLTTKLDCETELAIVIG